MRRRTALLAAVLTAASLSTAGCGVFMKFVGDRVADAITQKTANLQDVSARVEYITNLYPPDIETVETQAVPAAWKAGGNMISVIFQKRAGIGMWEIDGTVVAKKAGGAPEPLTYFGKGAYFLALPAGDKAPRTVEVRSATGQVATFQVKPAAPVKLKAVNGKPANAAVDLTKDLVIDLEDVGAGKLKVMMAATTLGIRTMTDVAICKPAKRIVVPAAAFKHMGVTASAAGFVGVDNGKNYVVVERYEGGTVSPGAAGAAFTMGKSWSHSPVTVAGDVKNAVPMLIEGKLENPRGALVYAVSKPQAFYGPPLARARQIAIGSLELRGTLYKQNTYQSQRYGFDNTVITTTTTITYAFPKVAPAAWDRLLEDAAGGLGGVFKGLGGNAAMVAPEKVLNAPSYKLLDVPKEHVSDTLVEKSYRKTRPLYPTNAASAFAGVSSTFALDRPFVRVLREAGADALLATSFDLQIATKKGDEKKVVLIPAMKFQLIGGANGYTVGPTTYATGWVTAQDGVTFSEAELADAGALRRIVRLDDMMAGLRAALNQTREEERKAGYEAIWALQ